MSEISDVRRLIKIHQRRWQKLKEQKAFSGPATDPAILMEIEDLEAEIPRLKRKLRALERAAFPLKILRQAVKWICGPVAVALTGGAWKELRKTLLTQASKLPADNYLDTALLNKKMGEIAHLTRQIRYSLEAHRHYVNPGGLAAVQELAPLLADYLLEIYRLEPGESPELEALSAAHYQ